MYKWLFIFSLLLGQVGILIGQQALTYPQMDLALIKLRKAIIQQDVAQYPEALQDLRDHWGVAANQMLSFDFTEFNIHELVEVEDLTLHALSDALAENDSLTAMEELAYFRQNLMDLRTCEGVEFYPLDAFWKSFDIYHDVRHIVNDQMMDLRGWFEFEDMITEMVARWNQYELIVQDYADEYFPGYNHQEQSVINEEMEGCMSHFIESLESGYRPDFIVPCDQVGYTMEKALDLYVNDKHKEIQLN